MEPNLGPLYRHADAALVRAVAYPRLAVPPWPDLIGTTAEDVRRWAVWLREVWALEAVAAAVEHASPALARQAQAVCAGQVTEVQQVRRAVASMVKYLLRTTGRATPFGLFAGVAPARFGPRTVTQCKGRHQAVARADAAWLAEVITRLEDCAPLLARLPVMATNTCFLRGDRLIVPYHRSSGSDGGAVEVSLRYTAAVRMAVEQAQTPIRSGELADRLAAVFPTVPPTTITAMLTELVRRRVLVSGLHAPSTVTDALGHLLTQADAADAEDVPQVADLVRRLRRIAADLERHNQAAPQAGRAVRAEVAAQMTAVSTVASQPLAVDLRLDCTLVLPRLVAREAEAAAAALARLSAHPFGPPAWQDYHQQFFDRYGVGALVPVLDLVDGDVGLGLPAGYLGSTRPERRKRLSARDERLLTLAQQAALDGCEEVVVDERLITDLQPPDRHRMSAPPHLEVCFHLQAASAQALDRGDFDLVVGGVSRGAGIMTGRFVDLLESEPRDRVARVFASLPVSAEGALPVQLSFPPLDSGTAHVTRAPDLLPAVISLAEHRPEGPETIDVQDLAVASDGHRLHLVSLARRRRVEPTTVHALDLRGHAPPLARFLAEVGRAHTAVVTGFDWGAAARLPFLPRLRYGHVVLSPARWLLTPALLPEGNVPQDQWDQALADRRRSRRIPRFVFLTRGDQRLPLDLDQVGHRVLLRTHLEAGRDAVLTQAPGPDAHAWFGGRVHEIVVPMVAARPARQLRLPAVSTARLLRRDHGHPPGASPWLYAKLYGHPDRVPEILADHLPVLLDEWQEPPLWWFIRYRTPGWHLRLRIALPDPDQFGQAAHRLSTWTARLRRLRLLHDVDLSTYYPESGRWGTGPVLAAAETVFAADSRALLAQFAQPSRPNAQALAAAHFVSIATAFTGSPEAGMNWLIQHARTEPSAVPRPVLTEAIRLADPTSDWAALRAAPGGPQILPAWQSRDQALADYRARLAQAEDVDPDAVMISLLHVHHIRAAGIDPGGERTCLRLARAAALSWNARTTSGR